MKSRQQCETIRACQKKTQRPKHGPPQSRRQNHHARAVVYSISSRHYHIAEPAPTSAWAPFYGDLLGCLTQHNGAKRSTSPLTPWNAASADNPGILFETISNRQIYFETITSRRPPIKLHDLLSKLLLKAVSRKVFGWMQHQLLWLPDVCRWAKGCPVLLVRDSWGFGASGGGRCERLWRLRDDVCRLHCFMLCRLHSVSVKSIGFTGFGVNKAKEHLKLRMGLFVSCLWSSCYQGVRSFYVLFCPSQPKHALHVVQVLDGRVCANVKSQGDHFSQFVSI